ncbi:hypothetical protein N0O92_13445 [Alkalihalobacillus sp. MEB130]|uniref:hypothetical protein n=1 Tax=Alkalihalobacillus sp. MEB130 TaxID=2976704 RepID=UPI0028E00B56|nr:hypothetical protein [Alkalihalobacillus sp. MEB130]MDT8861241.1 hypothetical protein [Alkalihalobacillus sp. MEB130]
MFPNQPNHRTKPPMSPLGFNPFEFGMQQVPMNTPFFKNFFKQVPPMQGPGPNYDNYANQPGQPFQMENPFHPSFMNFGIPSNGPMNHPFLKSFFGPEDYPVGEAYKKQEGNQGNNSPNPNDHDQTIQGGPQPFGGNPTSPFPSLSKINGGLGKAVNFYNQVNPMWKLISGFMK